MGSETNATTTLPPADDARAAAARAGQGSAADIGAGQDGAGMGAGQDGAGMGAGQDGAGDARFLGDAGGGRRRSGPARGRACGSAGRQGHQAAARDEKLASMQGILRNKIMVAIHLGARIAPVT